MELKLKKDYIKYSIFYLMIFIIIVYLVSIQLSAQNYTSDTITHLGFVKSYFEGTKYIPHPLWHTCVHFVSKIVNNNQYAAMLVTAFFVVLWLFLLHMVLYYLLCIQKKICLSTNKIILILIIVFLVGPAYLPFVSKYIYLGTWSPNVWHNVTLFTVKPFALLTFVFTILALEFKNKFLYILAILFLIISMFAKPSFAIIFIPALFIFYVIKRNYSKESILFIFFMFVAFISIAYFQLSHTYEGNQSKIIIDFLGVWSLYSSNIFISIFLGLFFPLIFFFLNPKITIKDDWIVFSWLMIIISVIVFMLFAESGVRYKDANFAWSYMISMSFLYFFTIIKFIEIFQKLTKYKKVTLSLILSYQFMIGMLYFIKVLMGYSFR